MGKVTNRFAVGDRVAERPRGPALNVVRKEMVDVVAANSKPRFGVIQDIVIKKNTSGQNLKYCLVLWDYQQTPSLHAHCRLCLESDWENLTNSVREGIGC
jgi:hypothetical protein